MNKSIVLCGITAFLTLGLMTTSCSKDDKGHDEPNNSSRTEYKWSEDGGLKACDHILFENNQIGNGDKEFVFNGKQTLKKGKYLLKGWVYIARGAVLTIEPGTIIKGDKTSKAAIIVERGGRLIAQGTQDLPIVFTSNQPVGHRKPGDWGGIILCGEATNNQKDMQIEGGPRTRHGGNNDNDNSGVLSYVRIEFAGYPFEKDKEINGLTFGSVGRGTKIDHVQVSYSNDDSFEWFGGAVNCKYMIAYKSWDDDFDTDNGFHGNVQYFLAVRDPKIADASLSNSFESDNAADGAEIEPYTTAVFSNGTFIGPKAFDKSFVNNDTYIKGGDYFPNNGSALGRFQAAMQIRRNSRLNCFNTIAVGYPVGLIVENDKGDSQGVAMSGTTKLKNLVFANMTVLASDKNKSFAEGEVSKNIFMNAGNKVVDQAALSLKPGKFLPIPCISGNNEILTGAEFTDPMLSGFDKVSYIGAFGQDDSWLNGWTNFDPNNTVY